MGGALGFCIGEEHVKMMALNGGKLQKKTNKQTKRKEKLSKKTRKGNLKNSISIVQIVKSKSQVLRILIYTRLKINKKNKSLYKFPVPQHVSFRKYSNLNFRVFTGCDTKIGILSR